MLHIYLAFILLRCDHSHDFYDIIGPHLPGGNKVEQTPTAQQTRNDADIDADVCMNTGMFDS